jgi:nucleotidyltransferase substrate binding protein (TIGR01987 family)
LSDGLIQRFEFTHEFAHKMLRRHLRMVSPTPDESDRMPFHDLIRTGNEQNLLLGDWPKWRHYRDLRARTSHTYAAKAAIEVVEGIPEFLAEAAYLRGALSRRLAVVLDLRGDEAAIVRTILREHLPAGAKAHVFGSRARGGARRYSDLALEWNCTLGLNLVGTIQKALSESDPPFKVDILDTATIEPAFKARISADWVPSAF